MARPRWPRRPRRRTPRTLSCAQWRGFRCPLNRFLSASFAEPKSRRRTHCSRSPLFPSLPPLALSRWTGPGPGALTFTTCTDIIPCMIYLRPPELSDSAWGVIPCPIPRERPISDDLRRAFGHGHGAVPRMSLGWIFNSVRANCSLLCTLHLANNIHTHLKTSVPRFSRPCVAILGGRSALAGEHWAWFIAVRHRNEAVARRRLRMPNRDAP